MNEMSKDLSYGSAASQEYKLLDPSPIGVLDSITSCTDRKAYQLKYQIKNSPVNMDPVISVDRTLSFCDFVG